MSAQTPMYIVTGGAGFIGSHLTERLLGEGFHVLVVDDLSTGRLENLEHARGNSRLKFLQTKVSECSELEDAVRQAKGIYHLAAAVGVELVVNSPIRTIRTNLDETEVILGLACRFQTPVLIASTSEVYGKSAGEAFQETDDLLIGQPKLGRWSYACSKLMDEFLALAYWREHRLPVTVARIFNTVGPRQTGKYGMVLPRFIEAAMKNAPLRVHGDGLQTRCFCSVLDTVEALTRLLGTAEAVGDVFNVGNDKEISIVELAGQVIAQTDSTSTIETIPYESAYGEGFEDMRRRKPDLAKIKRVTGYVPQIDLAKIVEDTAEYFSRGGGIDSR